MVASFTNLIGASRQDLASNHGDVHWVLKADPSTVYAPTPRFLGGASTRSRLDTNFGGRALTTREAGCLVCRKAYAYDSGLVVKDNNILLDSLLTIAPSELGAWGFFAKVERCDGGSYNISSPTIRPEKLGRAVLVLKRSDFVHGHWLLESLPKAYLALSMIDGNHETSYIVSNSIASYQVEMLEELGIPPKSLVRMAPGELIECEELWVPTLPHTNELWLHPEANAAYDTLVKAVVTTSDPSTPRDIFVTRSSRSSDPRPLYNAAQIEAVAVSYGFTLVDPGAVHWRDQIRIFSAAHRIVGLCGSGLHNTLFSSSSSHVCTLQQNQNNNFMQSSIAALRGHNVSYIVGETFSAFDESTWDSGFLIDANILDCFLRNFI